MQSSSGSRQPLQLYKEVFLRGGSPARALVLQLPMDPPNSPPEPPDTGTPGPFDGPQWPHQAPRGVYLSVAVLMGIVVISASVVNGSVIVVSIRYKKLRSPLNYILVNLAVADLLVTLCGSSVSFSNNISGFFVFGKRLCELEGFMVSLTGKGTTRETRLGLWLAPLCLAQRLWGDVSSACGFSQTPSRGVELASCSCSSAQGGLEKAVGRHQLTARSTLVSIARQTSPDIVLARDVLRGSVSAHRCSRADQKH